MGTRSKTSFIRKIGDKKECLVSVYQQYDGYIEGVGYEIANYILSKEICNGIRLGRDTSKLANGFDCLIAQFIRDFKTDVGGLYITTEDNMQEYNYNVIFDSDLYFKREDTMLVDDLNTSRYFEIEVIDWNNKLLYSGSLEGLLEFKEVYDDE